jgi:protocatechuate 3,4-dioxygenase beta subunit
MRNSGPARSKLIYRSRAFGTSSLLRPASAATPLPPTPRQTPGPFYPQSFPQDADNDLIYIAGHQGSAQGSITRITGRVLDLNGRAVPGARVEIWQCDVNGRYHYVRDHRTDQPRDENSRATGPRRPIQAAFNRNDERTDHALPLTALYDPLTNF